ncbi:zinc finger protein 436-like [Polypterus senegalus]|uniref:zinc finger protein 436-like n=1 Tax=Polypterus senegalus TaxID=55291 RepID=UPI001963362B|nr:zinc finger protein 436-like [Polypterus senegalus]XP_039617798.1 zinc finger protein 436-like [Polypterus senegalus]
MTDMEKEPKMSFKEIIKLGSKHKEEALKEKYIHRVDTSHPLDSVLSEEETRKQKPVCIKEEQNEKELGNYEETFNSYSIIIKQESCEQEYSPLGQEVCEENYTLIKEDQQNIIIKEELSDEQWTQTTEHFSELQCVRIKEVCEQNSVHIKKEESEQGFASVQQLDKPVTECKCPEVQEVVNLGSSPAQVVFAKHCGAGSPQPENMLTEEDTSKNEDQESVRQKENTYAMEKSGPSWSSLGYAYLHGKLQQRLQEISALNANASLGPVSMENPSLQWRPLPVDKIMSLYAVTPQRIQTTAILHFCHVCGKGFKQRSHCDHHQRIHTDEKPYSCVECGKRFRWKCDLQTHKRIHTGEKPYWCSECGKRFTRLSHLQSHKTTHTGEKPYCCIECGKLFTDRLKLHKHKRIHNGIKSHCCTECGKAFKSASHLMIHKRIHTGEKPYSCSECGKRFKSGSHLQTHKRIHSGEKPYTCTECGKGFLGKSPLQRHRKIHTGEKPYFCTECGKRFTQNCSLQTHMRIHTGEKPYCCAQCGKTFSVKYRLQKHERVHTGEKPYCCIDCGKRFTEKGHLKVHAKVHAGPRSSLVLET